MSFKKVYQRFTVDLMSRPLKMSMDRALYKITSMLHVTIELTAHISYLISMQP